MQLMDKPHGASPRFRGMVTAVHNLGEYAKLFEQMMPSPETGKFLDDVFKLRISVKDMIGDNSDQMTQNQIREAISMLATAQRGMCDKLFAP